MGYFPKLLLILPILLSTPAAHADGDMQPIGRFAIDRTEVSVGAFRRFVSVTGMVTMAERQGGGSVFEAGWVFKPGWTWSTPFGEPADEREPAVHVTFDEAQAYCRWAGKRLPTDAEWREAAHTDKAGVASGPVPDRRNLSLSYRRTPNRGELPARLRADALCPGSLRTAQSRHRPCARWHHPGWREWPLRHGRECLGVGGYCAWQ